VVNDVGGCKILLLVHPHIERSSMAKTKATIGDVKLRRTHAQIGQNAVEFLVARLKGGKVCVLKPNTSIELS